MLENAELTIKDFKKKGTLLKDQTDGKAAKTLGGTKILNVKPL